MRLPAHFGSDKITRAIIFASFKLPPGASQTPILRVAEWYFEAGARFKRGTHSTQRTQRMQESSLRNKRSERKKRKKSTQRTYS